MKNPKHKLHGLMKARFGSESNAASHSWLRSVTGKCHVSECNEYQLKKAIRQLGSKIRHSRMVRQKTWARIEQERLGK